GMASGQHPVHRRTAGSGRPADHRNRRRRGPAPVLHRPGPESLHGEDVLLAARALRHPNPYDFLLSWPKMTVRLIRHRYHGENAALGSGRIARSLTDARARRRRARYPDLPAEYPRRTAG